jgi:hypothetical protein
MRKISISQNLQFALRKKKTNLNHLLDILDNIIHLGYNVTRL